MTNVAQVTTALVAHIRLSNTQHSQGLILLLVLLLKFNVAYPSLMIYMASQIVSIVMQVTTVTLRACQLENTALQEVTVSNRQPLTRHLQTRIRLRAQLGDTTLSRWLRPVQTAFYVDQVHTVRLPDFLRQQRLAGPVTSATREQKLKTRILLLAIK